VRVCQSVCRPVFRRKRHTAYAGVGIDERIGPVGYWLEAFHFATALGDLMTKAMIGVWTPDMPVNFGVVIDRHNIDVSLAAWRESVIGGLRNTRIP
jgi:hypothetical protein